MAPAGYGGVPEEVQMLLQKHSRMKVFVSQYEEEWDLLDKVKDACSGLVDHKEKAKHLSLYGPGQSSQIQLKLDLNEWTTAQNNAMMKQDIIEVYIKDYRRQMASYEAEITKRGYSISKQGLLVAGSVLPVQIEQKSPASSVNGGSTTASVGGSTPEPGRSSAQGV